MPRDGSATLWDVATTRLGWIEVECSRCSRKGRYSLSRLIAERGAEARLTEFLEEITAECPQRQATAIYDRCAARFVGL